jgi:hypothetical protein
MRKLFVCTKDAWLASHHACHFHPVGGTDYIDLEGGLILVSASFNGEHGEERFTAHPDVAPLPDPIFEGNVTMGEHRDNEARKYSVAHHEALVKSLNVTDSDTVMDVSRKASARCKAVRIAHIK